MFLNCNAQEQGNVSGAVPYDAARSTTAAQAESGFKVRGCAPMQAEAEAGRYRVGAVAGLDGCKGLVVEDDAA